ncbi:MAG TPA: glycosyltransferase family 1 protein [Vicinamibacterales bacterium]|nr:glycosyltransferase family 1 protein [Vicinamibacterales bacterium]
MRIAIDVRKLHDFGIGTYVRNLLKYLALLDQDTEYFPLCRPQDAEALAALGPNFKPVPVASKPYSVSEQIVLPARLVPRRVDLLHEPHYVLPPLVPCRAVVTVHDCIHLMFPQYLPNRMAYAYARGSLWAATRRAERIFTVSETSKADILRYCDVPADRIVVVYNAIDDRFSVAPSDEAIRRARERYQLDGPFALYVGNIKPHKNIERLVDAFALVRRDGFERIELLIIGDRISKFPRLRRAVDRHKLHKHVRFLGFVPDDTLAALYRLATLFVFPSLYEGFGLPPLEAMASGTPVVTSNRSSLPEVVGDAAVLVDPYSAPSIAEGIRRVLADASLRRALSERGLARARQFSWEASVRRVHDVYMDVASGRPPAS